MDDYVATRGGSPWAPAGRGGPPLPGDEEGPPEDPERVAERHAQVFRLFLKMQGISEGRASPPGAGPAPPSGAEKAAGAPTAQGAAAMLPVDAAARKAVAASIAAGSGAALPPSARPACAPMTSGRRDALGPQPRVVRVFVSSAGLGLQAEREALRAAALPRLRALCDARGLFLHYVEPGHARWGPDRDEACAAGDGLLLSLREAQRASYFLFLAKDRYGWSAEDAGAGESFRRNAARAAEEHSWAAGLRDRSAPELEAARGRSAFFFGSVEALRDAARAEGREAARPARLLEGLKREIRDAGLDVREFGTPAELAAAASDALVAMLERDYPEAREPTWLESERMEHAAFAASRRRVYAQDPQDFKALGRYVSGSGPEPFTVYGPAGCGKTALMAAFAAEWSREQPADVVVPHFAACTQATSSFASFARRVAEELRGAWPAGPEVDANGPEAEVARQLRAALARAAHESPARLVLLLDAADQLKGGGAAKGLQWLPPCGPRLRVLLSCPRGATFEAARSRAGPSFTRELGTLSERRRRAVIATLLADQGRTLSEECMDRLVWAPPAKNPAFLAALVEEVCAYGPPGAALDVDLAPLLAAGDPRSLYGLLLRGAAARQAPFPLAEAALALVCSRNGLAEEELAAFLGVGGPGGPSPRAFAVALSDLAPLLANRAGLLTFAHRPAAEAAAREFGLGEPQRVALQGRLGSFFASRPPSQRRADEGPWCLASLRAGPSAALADLLGDPDVLRRLDVYDLSALWFLSERAPEAGTRYKAALPPGSGSALLSKAAAVVRGLNRVTEAIALYEDALREQGREAGAGHPETAATLQALASLQERRGDLSMARSLLEEAARMRAAALGPDHVEVAEAGAALAALALKQGDLAPAVPLLEAAARIRRAAWGPDDPRLASTLQSLAHVQCLLGRHSEALPHLVEALAILRRRARRHGGHGRRARRALRALGDLPGAALLFEEAWLMRRKASGAAHAAAAAAAAREFAEVLSEQKDLEGARAVLEISLEAAESELGQGHPEAKAARDALADILRVQLQGVLGANAPPAWRAGPRSGAPALLQLPIDAASP
eukprot:tig00000076_g2423.t1